MHDVDEHKSHRGTPTSTDTSRKGFPVTAASRSPTMVNSKSGRIRTTAQPYTARYGASAARVG